MLVPRAIQDDPRESTCKGATPGVEDALYFASPLRLTPIFFFKFVPFFKN
jgi:hypothetical protein